MEQHPIPQQISSYQFKLVGDMTLKQFFQVAGGVIIGLIFYSTPLHPIIKWPLILFFAGLGAAMAFLPFQERPLEKWIIAFFRSIYTPTLYTWKKTEKTPTFYTETAITPVVTSVINEKAPTEKNTTELDEAEKDFLSKVKSLWNVSSTAQSVPAVQTANSTTQSPAPLSTNPVLFTSSPSDVSSTPIQKIESLPVTPISVPQQVPTVITKSAPKLVVQETSLTNKQQIEISEIEAQKLEEKEITSNLVEFSIDAAPPSPPIAINTIVGQVMDQDRKIIEGAILEIKDSTGRPVRALKSNKAGHFIIVTPLTNGKYEVTIEKEGFRFDPVSFDADGKMIPPIAIKGIRN